MFTNRVPLLYRIRTFFFCPTYFQCIYGLSSKQQQKNFFYCIRLYYIDTEAQAFVTIITVCLQIKFLCCIQIYYITISAHTFIEYHSISYKLYAKFIAPYTCPMVKLSIITHLHTTFLSA